jgi:hypothetical protein
MKWISKVISAATLAATMIGPLTIPGAIAQDAKVSAATTVWIAPQRRRIILIFPRRQPGDKLRDFTKGGFLFHRSRKERR